MRHLQWFFACFLTAALLAVPARAQETTKEIPESQQQVQLSYAPLVKKAAPAVVNIFTSKKVQTGLSPFFNDPFFKQFFGNNRLFGPSRQKLVSSLGSGVIIRPDGLLITNNHVIKESDAIKVVLNDRREFSAKIVLTDARTDLAILKIDAGEELLPYLEFADSDELEVGDLVLAIGNPFGVGQTVTSGIVSALARNTEGISDFQFFIQTDAAINPGNSGGALVTMDGKVVGINTAIYSQSGGSNGIGFATPSNMARAVIRGAAQGGTIVRPWLGTISRDVNPKIAEALGLKIPAGVLLQDIYIGSAAELAGLQIGDVVTAVGGKDVANEKSLRFRIATFGIGEVVDFTVIRKGKELSVPVTMMRAVENPPREETKLTGDNPFAGLIIANLSPAVAEEMSVAEYAGVIVTGVWRRTPAKRIGFLRGDILEKVNDTKITSVKQLIKLLEKDLPELWKITARRQGQTLTITIRQ